VAWYKQVTVVDRYVNSFRYNRMIEVDKLTPDQIFSLEAQYQAGLDHMKYFNDTMKHFKFPERRLKTFDTKYYEKNLPEWEQALKTLGKI
jgi:hypothetical protein